AGSAKSAPRLGRGLEPGQVLLAGELHIAPRRGGVGGWCTMLAAALSTMTDNHVAQGSTDLECDGTAQAPARRPQRFCFLTCHDATPPVSPPGSAGVPAPPTNVSAI